MSSEPQYVYIVYLRAAKDMYIEDAFSSYALAEAAIREYEKAPRFPVPTQYFIGVRPIDP